MSSKGLMEIQDILDVEGRWMDVKGGMKAEEECCLLGWSGRFSVGVLSQACSHSSLLQAPRQYLERDAGVVYTGLDREGWKEESREDDGKGKGEWIAKSDTNRA